MIAPFAPSIPSKALLQTDLDQLSLILEETVEAYQKLLSLLQEEKSFIIEGDNDRLLDCVDRKEDLLILLSRLEKRRQKALLKIDPSTPPPTLKTLIPRLPIRYRDSLMSSHARLEALCASVHEINQMNGLLVNRVLGQITGLLGILQHMTQSGTTYQSTGLMRERPSRSRTIGRG